MSEESTDPFEDEDHVTAGARALKTLGFDLDHFWTPSAGRNKSGLKQVLVLGLNYIAIVSENGQVVLDVGPREIRGVRQREGSGLEVWVTSIGSSAEIRTRKWLHRVSDLDAEFLENQWLNLSPVTHSGVGLNPLHWKEDEYAYFVGRVVTEAAKCDVTLAELAFVGRSLLGESVENARGQSGGTLATYLANLGKVSPAIEEIADRYRAWFVWQNFAVHGVRNIDESGKATDQVYKWRRHKKPEPSNIVLDMQKHDFERLARVWHAFYMLNHDAFLATLRIVPAESPEEALRNIPLSNSVSDSERLPPS